MMVKGLEITSFRQPILLGFIFAIGGLTETLVRHSSDSLVHFLQTVHVTSDVLEEMSVLVEAHSGVDRVIIPLMDTLDLLLTCGALTELDSISLEKLFAQIKIQTMKTKNVKKLQSALKMCCLLTLDMQAFLV